MQFRRKSGGAAAEISTEPQEEDTSLSGAASTKAKASDGGRINCCSATDGALDSMGKLAGALACPSEQSHFSPQQLGFAIVGLLLTGATTAKV